MSTKLTFDTFGLFIILSVWGFSVLNWGLKKISINDTKNYGFLTCSYYAYFIRLAFAPLSIAFVNYNQSSDSIFYSKIKKKTTTDEEESWN